MTEAKNLYIRRGVLRVQAQGYWFSGGGEKGAFSYYPHLKDERGFPVYPDTQIKGDLATACHWLASLPVKQEDGRQDERKQGELKNLISTIFGVQGNEGSSPLYLTDLELTPESKDNEWTDHRFEVKSRIAIEDNRTVEEHMLVSFEYAFLDNLTLEATLYLGYFDNPAMLEKAAAFLKDAAQLLSGFGAFRSRGYGRGQVEIDWGRYPMEMVEALDWPADNTDAACFLTALNHVRNRPLDPEGTQLIGTRRSLAATQIRGWLARSYHDLYGDWPSIDEMRGVTFSDFHPVRDATLSFIPPRTTVRTEDKKNLVIKDMVDADANGDDEPPENLLHTKTKPLTDRFFVNQIPTVHEVRTIIRFRNVMAAPGDFRTREEGGLFAHEFVPAGTRFGGTVHFLSPHTAFVRRCRYILGHIRLVIASSIFDVKLQPLAMPEAADATHHLLTSDIPYDPVVINDPGNSLLIASRRGFNTVNGRPRRQRIVIAAGAVFASSQPGKTIVWSGFGNQAILLIEEDKGKDGSKNVTKTLIEIPSAVKKKLEKISPAQGGQLRELMHPGLTAAYLKDFLKERLAKYKQWKQADIDERLLPKELLEDLEIRVAKESVDMKDVRAYIDAVHHEIRRHWWKEKKKRLMKNKSVNMGGSTS